MTEQLSKPSRDTGMKKRQATICQGFLFKAHYFFQYFEQLVKVIIWQGLSRDKKNKSVFAMVDYIL